MSSPWLMLRGAGLSDSVPRSEYAHGVIYATAAGIALGRLGSWLASPLAWAAVLTGGILGAAMAKVWMLRLLGGVGVLAGALLAQRPAPATARPVPTR